MKIFRNVLRNKTVNSLLVAVLIGFSTVQVVQTLIQTIGVQGPPRSFWIREVISYAVILVIAWVVSWFSE